MTVFVDDRAVELYRGMQVKHALIALDPSLYEEAQAGRLAVRDRNGHAVGLEGGLRSGARLFTGRPDED